jgi:high-affinity Fe2+/Pb2+ permease
MNTLLRKRLEMAVRVRDLLRANNTDGVGQGLGLGRLEQLIERAQVLAAQQRAHRLARGESHQAFLTTARGMLEKAIAQQELLVKQGMSASLLEDLTAAFGEFEKTLEASRTGQSEQEEASDDLRTVADQIAEQVQVLDGLVRFRFGDDPKLMEAWVRARSVLEPSGVVMTAA